MCITKRALWMKRAYKGLFFEIVSNSHFRPCINNSCVQRPHSRPHNIHLHKQAGSRRTSRNFALFYDRVHNLYYWTLLWHTSYSSMIHLHSIVLAFTHRCTRLPLSFHLKRLHTFLQVQTTSQLLLQMCSRRLSEYDVIKVKNCYWPE
jgi:hypothetical protein